MQTKLSKFCGGVIEASWLGAIITIPIFFNVYSSRIFEPDKAALLRIFVLMGVSAWIIKIVDEFTNLEQKFQFSQLKIYFKTQLKKPMILAVVILSLVYFLSTLLSISPSTSFWGSYQRSQGFYTLLSYVLLFFLVASNIRSTDQINRIFNLAILTSLPVSLYGIIQHFGLDPVPWAGNVTNRISANMGNSIFIAAYLVMIIPITVIKILSLIGSYLKKSERTLSYLLGSVIYFMILSMQLAAVYFSGSRGPWIGLAVSLVAVWIGLAFLWRKPVLYFSGLVIFGISVIFLGLINVKNGPLEPLRTMPGIGRLGQLLDSESRTGRVRSLIWQGASQLVLPHEPLTYPDGSEDRLNVIRPFIGYGPESMFVAFNQFYPPELTEVEKRNAAPDRSHNEVWDSLVFTGLIGMLATITIFGITIIFCLKQIGLITDRKGLFTFYICTVGMSIITTVILLTWKGSGYFGVGLPLGLVLGVILFFVLAGYRSAQRQSYGTPEIQDNILLLGLLGAILAHSVELIFGFGITATRMYFWIFSGLVFVLGMRFSETPKVDMSGDPVKNGSHPEQIHPDLKIRDDQNRIKDRNLSGKRKKQGSPAKKKQNGVLGTPWFHEGIMSGLLLGLILVTIGFDYISIDGNIQNVGSVILNSFLYSGSSGSNSSLALLFLTTWILVGLVLILEYVNSEKGAQTTYFSLIIYGLSITIGIIFMAMFGNSLSSIIRDPSLDISQILKQVNKYESTFSFFVIFSIVLLIGFSWFSVKKWPQKFATLPGKILSPIIVGTTLVLIVFLNIRPIQADIVFKAADSYIRGGSWPNAIKLYNRAIDLAPKEDFYYLYLAKAYFEYSKTLPDETSRVQLLNKAENDMLRAQALNPLNTDHTANLARLYSTWSELIENSEEQTAKARLASDYYEQAVNLSPNNSRLLGEWAFILFSQLNQPEEAYRIIKRALLIDPKYDWLHGLLGEYYFQLAESMPEGSQEREEFYVQALDAYQKNFNFSSAGDIISRYRVMLSMARVLSRLGDNYQSIDAYLKALDIYPTTADKWRIHEVLARLYFQVGDKENALQQARLSLDAAPEQNQKQIQILINEIENHP